MTENLLQKIEEKVITLVTELEGMQKIVAQLKAENAALKSDKENFTMKLQGLIGLLDTMEPAPVVHAVSAAPAQNEYTAASA